MDMNHDLDYRKDIIHKGKVRTAEYGLTNDNKMKN